MGLSKVHRCLGLRLVAEHKADVWKRGKEVVRLKDPCPCGSGYTYKQCHGSCRCKKETDLREAQAKVKVGEAYWVVKERKLCDDCKFVDRKNCKKCDGRGLPTREKICPQCKNGAYERDAMIAAVMAGKVDSVGNPFVKTCDRCKGTGHVKEPEYQDIPSNDIVLIPHRTKGVRISTPRTPTIESKHIERAADLKEAAERIEEYGRMNVEVWAKLGARVSYKTEGRIKTRVILEPGKTEPQDAVRWIRRGDTWWYVVEGRKLDYGRPV